jgi:hypothetical protein
MFAMPAKLPLLNVRRDGEAVGPDDEEDMDAGEAVPATAAGEAADGEEEETEAADGAAPLVEATDVALPGNGDHPARSLPAATTWLKAGAAAAE